MMQFKFSPKESKFNGRVFYETYKGASFLRNVDNVQTILAKGYELRQSLKKVPQGHTVVVEKMFLEKNTPLLVKNTIGTNVPVEDFEFTYNRLTGLVAAYVFDNRQDFPVIKSSEATTLGLMWDNQDECACRLYLSAVSGTEHFHQFLFFPLVCALRKLQLKKITVPPVLKIANIKNDEGYRMAKVLMGNLHLTNELWNKFGGPPTDETDLTDLLAIAPPELKKVFLGTP